MEPNSDAERLSSVDTSLTDAPVAGTDTTAVDISARSRRRDAPPSFEDFYRRAAEDVRRALHATLQNGELARDATNEAMARALQRWSKVSRYDNPEGWVYRVGLNWATSWIRRRRRERERPLTMPTTAPAPQLVDHELQAALAGLSVDHRAVVVCRFLLDWSVDRTAEALDVPEGTVKSRLARALDNIRIDLENDQ